MNIFEDPRWNVLRDTEQPTLRFHIMLYQDSGAILEVTDGIRRFSTLTTVRPSEMRRTSERVIRHWPKIQTFNQAPASLRFGADDYAPNGYVRSRKRAAIQLALEHYPQGPGPISLRLILSDYPALHHLLTHQGLSDLVIP